MTNITQTDLTEPMKVDWDTAFSGGKYAPPPPALGPDGKPIVYSGILTEAAQYEPDTDRETGNKYLQYQVDINLKLAAAVNRLRAWVSTKPFTRKADDGTYEPLKGNPNKLASMLRSAGLQAKPTTNAEYAASVNAVKNRTVNFTIDWEARNKDTGEKIRGFRNFPEDPANPGQRRAILKKGDIVTLSDYKGNITGEHVVEADVLFANAVIQRFTAPAGK